MLNQDYNLSRNLQKRSINETGDWPDDSWFGWLPDIEQG